MTRLALLQLLAAVAMSAAVAASTPAPPGRDFAFADLGVTRLVAGGQDGLVVILADGGSAAAADALADAAVASGRSAAIVDLDAYFAKVAAGDGDCFEASTLFDVYAQQVQQELRFARFGPPALAGVGRGAAFLPLLLAGSRAGLFAAGVSVHPPAALALPRAPCGALAAQIGWQNPEAAVTVPADLHTNAPWTTSADPAPASVLSALDALRARAAAADAPTDLPLVELPQPDGGKAPWLVLVVSGDGGWANIDRDIAEELGTRGIAVLGWNSLRYFWEAKNPDVAAADLARVVRHYTRAWGKPRVLLVGYSLGADVLPFMASRAPPDVRAAIAGLVLLAPAQSVDFQFHISNWLGGGDAAPYPLAPEMNRLGDLAVLCLYPADESDDALCPVLAGRRGVAVQALPGDHHFDGDYGALTRAILQRFPVAD